jgi:hypothetical protein
MSLPPSLEHWVYRSPRGRAVRVFSRSVEAKVDVGTDSAALPYSGVDRIANSPKAGHRIRATNCNTIDVDAGHWRLSASPKRHTTAQSSTGLQHLFASLKRSLTGNGHFWHRDYRRATESSPDGSARLLRCRQLNALAAIVDRRNLLVLVFTSPADPPHYLDCAIASAFHWPNQEP